jgi:hypothetical protein
MGNIREGRTKMPAKRSARAKKSTRTSKGLKKGKKLEATKSLKSKYNPLVSAQFPDAAIH